MNRKVLLGFLIAFLLHGCLFVFKNYYSPEIWSDALQQENYLAYVEAMASGNFSNYLSYSDSRLFPGLPLLILLLNVFIKNKIVAGIFLTVVGLIVIVRVVQHFTNSVSYAVLLTLFPPIVFEQSSKISTEVLVIALLLLAYWLVSRKEYLWTSLLLGYATIVRPISGCMFLALLVYLITSKKLRVKAFLIYLIFPLLLLLFNIYHWGLSSSFRQIEVYSVVNRTTVGIYQLIEDVSRAIDWGQWRILVSGLTYVVLYGFVLTKIIKKKGDFLFKNDGKLIKCWSVFTSIFILLPGSTPFLEEIRRYMAIFFPLALLVNYKYFLKRKALLYLSLASIVIVFI